VGVEIHVAPAGDQRFAVHDAPFRPAVDDRGQT
jgi:hypothetical protein